MNAGAVQLMLLIGGVEDVALDQEMLQRSRRGRRDDAFHRLVADMRVRGHRAEGIVAM